MRAAPERSSGVSAGAGGDRVGRLGPQVQADRAEQDLWTEATDPVPAGAR
ncbi:DLW-39 family protein [Kitasatospora atroaurantiaca]